MNFYEWIAIQEIKTLGVSSIPPSQKEPPPKNRPIPRSVNSFDMMIPIKAAREIISNYIKNGGDLKNLNVNSIEFAKWQHQMHLAYEEAREAWLEARKSFRQIENQDRQTDQIRRQLSFWVDHDESVSQEWQHYMKQAQLKNPNNYLQVAKQKWINDKNDEDCGKTPCFGRQEWQPQASKFIKNNIEEIFSDTGGDWNNPSSLLLAWHIVQHMDSESMKPFQKWFLQEFEKHGVSDPKHPNYRQYQFLHDRTTVNQGGKQKYGTQGDRGLIGHVNPS